MKKIFTLVFLVNLFFANLIHAQCTDQEFCNGNSGIYSTNDASSIAYDNMGSSFHSTFIREPSSGWKIWGEHMGNNGIDNVLSPTSIRVLDYPAITGVIYKMAIGSSSIFHVQLVVLTSTGLFVLGDEGSVLDNAITTSATFQKIVIDGKSDGLPANVFPLDVKMIFATNKTLIITTCTGEVYVLSQDTNVRGDGGIGNSLKWSKVMMNATSPLTNIVVTRGCQDVAYALRDDGTIWSWGSGLFLGNGTSITDRFYATQMTLPAGITKIKMIQSTNDEIHGPSFYILGTDKKVYSLGHNNYGQLGDRTVSDRLSWVNAKNPDGSIINDAAWISANEHDNVNSGLAVIKTNGLLYTAGYNSSFMVGRTVNTGTNFLDIPTGITVADVITNAEVGGHTCALIKQGSPRYGYVGHRANGSMGDGSLNNQIINTYDFNSPPVISVCGMPCPTPSVTSNGSICPNQKAIFTITGVDGDIINYNIDGKTTQTVTIGSTGSVDIISDNTGYDQTINLTYLLGGSGACSNKLSIYETVTVNNESILPTFTQVTPICQGEIIYSLPSISNNGIEGTWSPSINNMQTTTYTFTPSSQFCASITTMIIVVNPKIVPTFTPLGPICRGDSVNSLPTISNNGVSGSWYPPISNTQTFTYTFTPNTGYCANSTQMTVVVNQKINPVFTQPNPICQGGSQFNLPTTSINGIIGSWLPVKNNNTTTLYTFTPDSGTCANPAQMTVVVTPKTVPTFSDFNICYGDTQFVFPTVSTNGITGTWSPILNSFQTTIYTFTPNSGECATATTKPVTVYNNIDFEVKNYCQGGSYILEVVPNKNSFDIETASITWKFNSSLVYTGSPFNVSSFLSTISNTTLPITFSVNVESNGCRKDSTVNVDNVNCGIQKGISPNNDNLNDFLDLKTLNVKLLSIFNRYGVKVYTKEGYKDEWHGQTNTEEMLPDGVYYYVIDIESKETKSGWIYINRND